MLSGYGVKFCHGNKSNGAVNAQAAWPLIRDGYIKQADTDLLEVYLSSFVTEEGTRKERPSSLAMLMSFSFLTPYRLDTTIYSALVPQAIGQMNAHLLHWYSITKAKKPPVIFCQYEGSALAFDAKLKNGLLNGEGTSYYANGQVKYHGNWKNDLYDGKGTLYDEDGSVIYSGKWEKGDYAS